MVQNIGKVKALKARLRAQIFFKFHVMVTNNLNIESVNFLSRQ